MVDEPTLQQVVKRVVASAQPSRIILFGSYGRGDADEGSDLDLMVVLPEAPDKYNEMIRLRKAVGSVGVGVDVLVYSEAEYQRRSQVPGTVLYWARNEGRQLTVFGNCSAGRSETGFFSCGHGSCLRSHLSWRHDLALRDKNPVSGAIWAVTVFTKKGGLLL
jgi:predicted nucleotidyltransferase